MNKNRIYSLSALALILASIGAVSAMWYQSLRVNVAVNTGDVAVKWSNWSCNDNGPDPQIPDSEFNNSEGKDVAQCMVKPEINDSEGNTIKLNVTITNAYPGYHANVTLVVDNIGTIPVKLYQHTMTGVNSDALAVSLQIPQSTQIHPGSNGTYYLVIDVLQAANQSSTYSFEVNMTFAQWNEVTGP